MLAKTNREVALVALWISIYALATMYWVPSILRNAPDGWKWVSVIAFTFIALLAAVYLAVSDRRPEPVDIWRLQRKVMRMSGQAVPSTPHITRDGLLYLALVAEELSKAMGHHHEILKKMPWSEGTALLTKKMGELSLAMHNESIAVRAVVSHLPYDFTWSLAREDAVALLDDACDMAVVVAGFAVSMGLPAAEGYKAVVLSNISKADPVTRMIEKDRSGKWIKGVNYQPPNLAVVLETAWQNTKS